MKIPSSCAVVALCFAIPLMAQSAGGDPITSFLTQLMTVATSTWARLLVVIGVVILGAKYMFSDQRDHGELWKVAVGGVLIIGAQAFASYWFH